jgi:hypothetical protein
MVAAEGPDAVTLAVPCVGHTGSHNTGSLEILFFFFAYPLFGNVESIAVLIVS